MRLVCLRGSASPFLGGLLSRESAEVAKALEQVENRPPILGRRSRLRSQRIVGFALAELLTVAVDYPRDESASV